MSTPYTSGPHIVSCVGGQEKFVELRCPSRGTIVTLKFDQISGIAAGCEFELYSRREAAPPGASSESLSEAVQGPQSAWSIFGPKTYTAGTPFFEDDGQYIYQNNDGGPSNRLRKLYLRLVPSGSGAKEYALTMEIDMATPG